jgi:predicted  nucleic acid-binding Zn-ribbon protein
MTNTPQNQPDRLDRIEVLLERVTTRLDDLSVLHASTEQQINDLAQRQSSTQEQLDNLTIRQVNTQHQLDDLVSTANNIFARDAVLNDVLLELRDSHEQHQRNFEEHQRTTNAALQSLEAILLQLIRNFQ